jgi:carbon storage regulator
MLVLSRRLNEAIVINDNITIKVLEIRGDKVRLGIVAEPSITVHREEVYLRIKQEQEQKESNYGQSKGT